MLDRLIPVAALLLLGSAAAAQTSGTVAGRAWSGPIADAFFTDQSMLTLRPHAEITSNWRNLSEIERQRVRRDCAALGAGSPQVPTPAPETGAADAPAEPAAAPKPQPSPATPGADADAADQQKRGGGAAVSVAGSRSLAQICSIVQSM